MQLPISKVQGATANPKLLVIAGFYKSGKTTSLAALENNLVVDTEKGSIFVDAMRVDVPTLREYSELIRALGTSEHRYRFITVDTGTKLEDIALELAAFNHKKSPIGKRWEGTAKDILNLPNGLGYGLLRNSYMELLSWLKPYCDTLILVCHIKTSSFQKDGEEFSQLDINLTGQLKTIIAAEADAVGMFYRKGNRSILSFKGGESFLVGARPSHLKNKDFTIIESDESGSLKIDWSQVFPS